MFFFFSIIAIIIDKTNEKTIIKIKLMLDFPTKPSGTFIPINDETIVGIENTIVIPAKNFITSFKLLEIIVA